jgi:serine protease Do
MTRISRWGLALASLLIGMTLGCLLTGSRSTGQNPPKSTPAIPREMTSYRDVVKQVLPGVVSIEAKVTPKKQEPKRKRPDNFNQWPREMQQLWEEQERKREQAPPDDSVGFGSGVLVDPSGIVLTSFHVVEGAEQVEVQLTDGRKFTSKNVLIDKKTDIAVVRLQSKKPLPFLDLADSDAMEVGDRVLALGAPFGLTGSVTSGIVSAKGRSLRLNMFEDFLQTDAAINPGNSGGPLVNLEGKVIGINSAIKSRSGGFQGVGMAISSNLGKSVMQQLLKDGSFRHG